MSKFAEDAKEYSDFCPACHHRRKDTPCIRRLCRGWQRFKCWLYYAVKEQDGSYDYNRIHYHRVCNVRDSQGHEIDCGYEWIELPLPVAAADDEKRIEVLCPSCLKERKMKESTAARQLREQQEEGFMSELAEITEEKGQK